MIRPALALCPPAWRMVLVICFDPIDPCQEMQDDPDPAWCWCPVIAVRSMRIGIGPEPDDYLEHDDLLVWDEGEEIVISVHELTRDLANPPPVYPSKVVVCTWPPEEDNARFLEVARQLAERMKAKAQRSQGPPHPPAEGAKEDP